MEEDKKSVILDLQDYTQSRVGNIGSRLEEENIYLVDEDNGNIIDEFYFKGDTIKYTTTFIKRTEKLIRTSEEYSRYIAYLGSEQKLIYDSIMANIKTDMATLEFHHFPFTLFDITSIVLERMLNNDEKVTTFSLAREVLKIHFDNKVGMVRLSKTNHELAHSGAIQIPLKSIFGDVNGFIEDHYDYIPEDLIEKYNKIVEADKTADFSKNADVLGGNEDESN